MRILFALVVLFCIVRGDALAQWQSHRSTRGEYRNFEQPHPDEWQGNTEYVDHPIGQDFLILSANFGNVAILDDDWATFDSADTSSLPIELLDSKQTVLSESRASLNSDVTGDYGTAVKTHSDIREGPKFNYIEAPELDWAKVYKNTSGELVDYNGRQLHPLDLEFLDLRNIQDDIFVEDGVVHFDGDWNAIELWTAESQVDRYEIVDKEYGGRWAHYAEVFNEQDVLLAEAKSITDHSSVIVHDTFEASGRVLTETYVREGLADNSSGSAGSNAESSAFGQYRVNETMDFVLDAKLARVGDVDLELSLVNRLTGESVVTAVAPDGEAFRFELCGTLEPGEYDLSISAVSDALQTTTDAELGGYGEFELFFYAFPYEGSDSSLLPHGEAMSVPESSGGLILVLLFAMLRVRKCTRPPRFERIGSLR